MSAYNNFTIARFKDGELSLDRRVFNYRPSSNDKFHTVLEGERLDSIAYKYYKDSTLWHIIADVNVITNPFSIEPGDELVIPALI